MCSKNGISSLRLLFLLSLFLQHLSESDSIRFDWTRFGCRPGGFTPLLSSLKWQDISITEADPGYRSTVLCHENETETEILTHCGIEIGVLCSFLCNIQQGCSENHIISNIYSVHVAVDVVLPSYWNSLELSCLPFSNTSTVFPLFFCSLFEKWYRCPQKSVLRLLVYLYTP